MTNIVELEKVEKIAEKFVYHYHIEGDWAKAFRLEREFFIEYSTKLDEVPESISVIPFLAEFLPIAWVYDAEIRINEVDMDFLESIEEVKRSYVELYPSINFGGRITVKNVVINHLKQEENKSLLFFSGGVDATSSLIKVREERPLLFTLWGTDIFFQDIEGWRHVEEQVRDTAEKFNLPFLFAKTSMRHILNYEVLNEEIAKPVHENWWHGFQHGIAIIASAAPIAYCYNIRRIYLAATLSVKSTEDYICASTPTIDNNVRFFGCTALHEGYENSRNDKIRKICYFSKKKNVPIKLRVCWETRTGYNCCRCEKCVRTLLSILSEGYDPNDFGFNIKTEEYEELLHIIENDKLKIPILFWTDIIYNFSLNKELQSKYPVVKYLVDKYPKYGKNYKKEFIPTPIVVEETSEINRPILFRRERDFSSVENAFVSVAMNTGNLVFEKALQKNLNVQIMPFKKYQTEQDKMRNQKVITTDLIWINENSDFDYLYRMLSEMKYQTFVPISVGIQSKKYNYDFKLNKSVLKVLSAIQERAVIGVRGEYTADILEKNGIKNIEIIGCPSLYYWHDENHTIQKKEELPQRVVANFRTFYELLDKNEKHFLSYCANHGFGFIEQTKHDLKYENVLDAAYFKYVSKWLSAKKQLFFDIEKWTNYTKQFQFSIGARFHGNVVALWNYVPALFLVPDARVEEMVRYFNLPYIKMEEFDEHKPLSYYYELADYTEFNKGYRAKYRTYMEFLKRNGITS